MASSRLTISASPLRHAAILVCAALLAVPIGFVDARESCDWAHVANQIPDPLYEVALQSARDWVSENKGWGGAGCLIEYRIESTDRGFRVSLAHYSVDTEGNVWRALGGHSILYVDHYGEVYNVFTGS